jgi:poly [ADP-ribose] polymerase
MSRKFAKLMMVAINDGKSKGADQSNKYYEMEWDGMSSNFNVKYGRYQSTEQHATYPISKWDTKYNEKVRKGYKDVTHTVSVVVTESKVEDKIELAKVEDAKVEEFLTLMQKYTKGLVAKTYTVKAKDVTQSQVDEAQGYINNLTKIDKKDVTSINNELLKLYMVIPRYMDNVRNHLLPNIKLENVLQQEQDNLDAMASQVKLHTEEAKPAKTKKVQKKTLLDLLGVDNIKQVKSTTEIDYLVKQITGKRTILEQGLRIRPTGNFQFSGKAYGNGNYFSEQFSTSIGYTDGRYNGDAVMLIYEVHIGKESTSHFHDYNSCKRAGYDSFNGGWLRVAYNEEQSKIKYIIWLK